jgi:hypothetical protein
VRGPVPFDRFRQRVRRHRASEVLGAVSALSAQFTAASFGQVSVPRLPNYVQPFALAGVARAALLYGNEHRDSGVTVLDLVEMCFLHANVHDPALDEEPGDVRLRGLMHRIAYEQFGHQFSEMENIGRTLLMFEDHAAASPRSPSAGDWESLLGTSLLSFMELGFALHVAALSNGGGIAFDVLRMDHVAPIFGALSADAALGIIDQWYSSPVTDLRAAGLEAEVLGVEKWSLNPLVARPLVRLTDRYLMPCPRWVIDRFTPTGLYFIGWEAWGSRFTDALGDVFEAYVGTQLGLLEHATVHGEIVYGTNGEKTVDYFVVTEDAVLLIEAKAARPITATRLGRAESDDDVSKKVGKAISQINNTARLLGEGHSALAHVNPTGLPLVGVVVTLEEFHLVNTFLHDILSTAEIPTAVASAHELEGVLAVVFDRADVGSRIMAALRPDPPAPPSLSAATDGLPNRPNPLLDQAWDRFRGPFEEMRARDELRTTAPRE